MWRWLGAAALCAACSGSPPVADAGAPPAPLWSHSYPAGFFSRGVALDCAPGGAPQGGCLALIHYWGGMDGFDAPTPGGYGGLAFVRLDAQGNVLWADTRMRGYDPLAQETGAFVDDDLRLHLLADDSFLVSGSYSGRVLIGQLMGTGDFNQELGPATGHNLFLIIFHPDATFDDWEDTGNGLEQHATGAASLPDTDIVIAGSCQGEVPMDTGSFDCGGAAGYLLTVHADGSTAGAQVFTGQSFARAQDVASDGQGGLFVSGSFDTALSFNSGSADPGAGGADGFLARVNADGSRAFVALAQSPGDEAGGWLANVDGGVLWTASVGEGARVGAMLAPAAGEVIAKFDAQGDALWVRAIAEASAASGPLRIAAAADGSFALFGPGYLGLFNPDGSERWHRGDADVSSAGFTQSALVAAGSALGGSALGPADAGSGTLAGFVAAFAR